MVNIGKVLFEKPKDTGFRFGFIAILLVSIAFIYPSFYNIGYTDPSLIQWTTMLIIGLLMSIMFSVMVKSQSQTRIDVGITAGTMAKQIQVLIVGIIAGLVLVAVNVASGVGFGLFSASTTNGLFMGLLAGVSEELFFRGFIQNMIRIYVPSLILAIIPSAVVFALFHYFAYGLEPMALGVMFMLGIFLGLLHEIFNDIGVPMLAHILNNIFAMLPAVLALLTGNIFIIVLVVGIVIVSYMFAGNRGK